MELWIVVALYCWAAGLAMVIGGLGGCAFPSRRTAIRREIVHATIAFGGGILIAAVALALVPKGLSLLPISFAVPVFFGGSAVFMLADERLARSGGSRAQFMAMLLDFVPEAVSLGAVFPVDHRLGVLLALFIGAQNLPEGFNAYRELASGGSSPRRILTMILALSLLGPVAGLLGYFFLQTASQVVGGIMLFAAGGILYLVFQDIAPQAKMKRHWVPALGGTVGFIVGMVCEALLR